MPARTPKEQGLFKLNKKRRVEVFSFFHLIFQMFLLKLSQKSKTQPNIKANANTSPFSPSCNSSS
jgi:hypothetical protein